MVRKPSVVIVWYTPSDSALANKSLVGHWQKSRETDWGGGENNQEGREGENGRKREITFTIKDPLK